MSRAVSPEPRPTDPTLQFLSRPGPGAVGRACRWGPQQHPGCRRSEGSTHLWITEKQSEAPVVTLNNCGPVPLQAAADKESSRAQQQAFALQQQCAEHIRVLEAQLAALEQARAADQAAAEHKAVSEEGGGPGWSAPGSCVAGPPSSVTGGPARSGPGNHFLECSPFQQDAGSQDQM